MYFTWAGGVPTGIICAMKKIPEIDYHRDCFHDEQAGESEYGSSFEAFTKGSLSCCVSKLAWQV